VLLDKERCEDEKSRMTTVRITLRRASLGFSPSTQSQIPFITRLVGLTWSRSLQSIGAVTKVCTSTLQDLSVLDSYRKYNT